MKDTCHVVNPHAGNLRLAILGLMLVAYTCAELCRADATVRTEGLLLITNDAEVVSASTVASGQVGVPSDMPDPVYWIDASDTNGWTIVTEGAYQRVKTVPSKGSSTRYATTDVSAEAGDTWYGWQANATTLYSPRMPYLIDDPDLLPGKALDFVAPGTSGYAARIGLVFNKVSETPGATPTNAMYNIGTVIAVYGSHDGRGWFLGGGRSSGGKTYEWNRATSQMESNIYDWTCPLIQARSTINTAQTRGVVRHDGLPTSPEVVGLNHAWEVLSWTMETATAVATGIGVGDTRGAGFERTGQQRIAEMIIFDQVLPVEMVEKIETYLNAKWFGRRIAGCGGKAEIGTLRSVTTAAKSDANTGIATEVAVPANETLTIGRIEGGRGLKSVVRKTGAGALAVRDATDYGGKLALAGGTLSVPLKTIPESIEKIVTNCYYHADASQIDDFDLSVESGTEYVMGWRNRADGKFSGESVMLAPIAASRRPWLVRNALGEGKHVVDFGAYSQSSGHYMSFTTSSATTSSYPSEKGINGIVTVVAVYGAHGSGASIFNKTPWSRPVTGIDPYLGWASVNMLDTSIYDSVRGLSASNAVVFADGVRLNPAEAWFGKPGYQILAIRNPGLAGVARIGCSTGNTMGGFQLGEIYVFRRQLSDDEIADLSAYLTWKWFGSEMNGYAASTRRRNAPDIAELEVESASTFEVATGKVVRVGTLGLSAPLTVSGGGTLEVGELKNASGMALDAKDATVRVTGPMDPSANAEIAADPAYHLDPCDTAAFEIESENGTNFVARARDRSMRHELFASTASRRPWLDGSVISAALPVLNFGPFDYYGRLMAFDRPIDAVRSVYAVWAPNDDGATKYAFMFGSTDRMPRDPLGGRLYDYHRGVTANAQGLLPLFLGNDYQSHVTGGEIYVDGVRTNRMFAPKAGELRLIQLHHTAPAHIAAFATDRKTGDPGRNGGSMFGETLIYTRVLSEREKVATRNYLMKKWFGKTDAELAELPPPTTNETRRLAGEGEFVKSGSNTLAVGDLSAFTGTVSVTEGTLSVTKAVPAVAPGLVTEGLVFHVDANQGIELVDGTADSVKQWSSTLGDGWSAVSRNALADPVNSNYPKLLTGMKDDTPFVRMNHNKGEFMVFCKNGVRTRIKNIKTVFWVVGTDDGAGGTLGGGFLLGGGNASDPDAGTSRWDWHRGGSEAGAYRGSNNDPLTCGSATAAVRDGKWYMDGVNVKGDSVGLGSNRWHYVTAVPSASATYPASADGFAFDGRWLEGDAGLAHRTGGQSLAEVLIYNRTLSDEERLAVEAYLASKWGFAQRSNINSVDLNVSEGAIVDCGGNIQYFKSISGAGSVAGDVSVGTLVADAAATSWSTVSGSLILPSSVTVELRNLPSSLNGVKIKVLNCAGLVRPEGEVAISFIGVQLPDYVRTRLSWSEGALWLKLMSQGIVISFR